MLRTIGDIGQQKEALPQGLGLTLNFEFNRLSDRFIHRNIYGLTFNLVEMIKT